MLCSVCVLKPCSALDGAWGPRPGGGGRGWEVSSILTAPLIQEGDVANSNIVLGEKLTTLAQ